MRVCLVVAALLLALCVQLCAGQIGPPGLCCMPNQFEGFLGASGMDASNTTLPSFMATVYSFSYDGPTARSVVEGNLGDDVTKILTEYLEPARAYVVRSDGSCTLQAPDHTFRENCELAQFVRTASYYFGLDTRTSIDAFTTQDVTSDYAHYYVFTNDCNLLIYEDYETDGGSSSFYSYGMLNLTAGIQDSSVFDPPGNCVPAPPTYINSVKIRSLMGAFMIN